jgi:hypothetical protein
VRRSWTLVIVCALVSSLLFWLGSAEGGAPHLDNDAPGQLAASRVESASLDLLIEAEDGDISSPLRVGEDSSASGGAYISATSGSNTESPEREASYEFSVSEDGAYYLWARLYGPDEDSDAIYIGLDGSWNRVYPDTTGQYVWVRVATSRNSDEYGFSLSSGAHEIQVGHAELYTRLDALVVTDDPDFQPGGTPNEPPDTPDDLCASGDVECLINAINDANASEGDDVITLAPGVYSLTKKDNDTDGPNGLPSITSNITINGNGASIEGTASYEDPYRIFHVAAGGRLELNDVTVAKGFISECCNGETFGGGIYVRPDGEAVLNHSTVRDNVGDAGAGIHNRGTMQINNSAVRSNGGYSGSGGVFNEGTMEINNSTISDNYGDFGGAGIGNVGQLTVNDSDISRNEAEGTGGIYNAEGGLVVLNNTTLTDHETSESPSTISNDGTMELDNTTIRDNAASNEFEDFAIENHGRMVAQSTTIVNNGGTNCMGNPIISRGENNQDDDGSCFQVTQPKEPSCPTPTITLSASSGKPGDTITVQGNDWLPGGDVAFSITDEFAQYDMSPVRVPDSGEWKSTITVPDDATPGNHEMVFSEEHGGCLLRVTERFTIVRQETPTPTPTITLDPTEGPPGMQVVVQGSGWIAGDTVIIHFAESGNEVAQAIVDDDGRFETTFTVPDDAESGEQKVIAITADGIWGADAAFRVTEPKEEPRPPSYLRLFFSTIDSIKIGWADDYDDETGFEVAHRAAGTDNWSYEPLDPNTTTWEHPNLTTGASYEYKVRVCNSGGCSQWTSPITEWARKQWDDPSNFKQRDYGLYWFRCGACRGSTDKDGKNGKSDGQTAVPGQNDAYYDPTKPTLIYVHGWQFNQTRQHRRESMEFELAGGDEDIMQAWKDADPAWNVGIFYWNQFADDAIESVEDKIWAYDTEWKMRYKLDDNKFYYDFPRSTVMDLFFNAYKVNLNTNTSGNIRIVGHSVGHQLAVRTTMYLSDHTSLPLPQRVALLDPHWSWWYPEGIKHRDAVSDYISTLKQRDDMLFEYYDTTLGLTRNFLSVSNQTAYSLIHPDYAVKGDVWDPGRRHQEARYWYFSSMSYEPPEVICDLYTRKCGKTDKFAPSAKMPDTTLGKLLKESPYWWEQWNGKEERTVLDDTFARWLKR